jgi:hypothetical protein
MAKRHLDGRYTTPKRVQKLHQSITPQIEDELKQCADLALADAREVIHHGTKLILVPDVLVLERQANGMLPPGHASWRMERPDGRAVYLFRPTVEQLPLVNKLIDGAAGS